MESSCDMNGLPATDASPLVRTDFSDPIAWTRLLEVLSTETVDGFRAYVEVVDDPSWQDARPEDLASAIPANSAAAALFIGDRIALSDSEFPVLVVDLWGDNAPFRCIARELWGPANNLNIANMDFDEFAGAAGSDGVFRGFPGQASHPA